MAKTLRKQELWFLHSARRHMVLDICMKFHPDIMNGFQIIEQVLFCNRYCYLQSSNGHMVLNICMTFHEIVKGFKADTIFSQKLLLRKFKGT